LNIVDVIYYISAGFKVGVWIPWQQQTCQTCRRSKRLYGCVCHVCIYLVL